MLWFSAIVLFLLTLVAWWNGMQFKAQKESAGLGNALYVAAAFGAMGTVCFIVAAML